MEISLTARQELHVYDQRHSSSSSSITEKYIRGKSSSSSRPRQCSSLFSLVIIWWRRLSRTQSFFLLNEHDQDDQEHAWNSKLRTLLRMFLHLCKSLSSSSIRNECWEKNYCPRHMRPMCHLWLLNSFKVSSTISINVLLILSHRLSNNESTLNFFFERDQPYHLLWSNQRFFSWFTRRWRRRSTVSSDRTASHVFHSEDSNKDIGNPTSQSSEYDSFPINDMSKPWSILRIIRTANGSCRKQFKSPIVNRRMWCEHRSGHFDRGVESDDWMYVDFFQTSSPPIGSESTIL